MSEKKGLPVEKTMSRLMAVQALYSQDAVEDVEETKELLHIDDEVIAFFKETASINPETDEPDSIKADKKFFKAIFEGAVENLDEIDSIIKEFLDSGWTIERIGSVLRSILRAAIYEMLYLDKAHANIIINEYVGITRSFFNDSETGFVNALLDSIAKKKT